MICSENRYHPRSSRGQAFRDHAPCVRRLAAYDRRRNPSTQQTKSIEGVKLWSRQYAFTSTAVPKLWFLRTFKLRRPARARSRSSSMLAASISSTAISAEVSCRSKKLVAQKTLLSAIPSRHGRYVIFQMAEVAVPRGLFHEILRLIAELRPQPPP